MRWGGNVNDGANDGPCYFNANNAPSNANWNYGAALNLIQCRQGRLSDKPAGWYSNRILRLLHSPFRGWQQPKYFLLERLSKRLKGRKGKRHEKSR